MFLFDSALRAYWMEVPRRQVWQLGDEYYRRFIRAGNPLSVVSPTLLKSRGRATKTLEETIASNANYGVLWPVRDGYSLWYLPRQYRLSCAIAMTEMGFAAPVPEDAIHLLRQPH